MKKSFSEQYRARQRRISGINKLILGTAIAGSIVATAMFGDHILAGPEYRKMRKPTGWTKRQEGVDFKTYWGLARQMQKENPFLKRVNPHDIYEFILKSNRLTDTLVTNDEIRVPVYD